MPLSERTLMNTVAAVLRFKYGDIGEARQQSADAFAHDDMVVHDQQLHERTACWARGRVAW